MFFLLVSWTFGKPMESIERYNVILVHGAADSESGMDCSGKVHPDPFDVKNLDSDGYRVRIEGGKSKSPATGLIKELRPWLTETVFGGDKSIVYLQRPFTNPANRPDFNARELGDPMWLQFIPLYQRLHRQFRQ
jgi:hypothetical protein